VFRLKELREEKGLNMRQTALSLKIPYTTYISYEKGEREPNSEMLIILAEFFDCSIDYLVGRNVDKKINGSNPELLTEKSFIPPKISPLTRRQERIIELFNELTEEQQDNIIGRVEMLVELNEQEYKRQENA
jgi:transcriptional regulator with XRE-family HTH domain